MKIQYVLLLAAGLIAVIVGASLFGYGKWDDSRTFVSTGDAQVVADLIQVGSSDTVRIIAINVDEGDSILEGEVIATVEIGIGFSRPDNADTANGDSQDVKAQRADVLAPRSGVIVARWAIEGDFVPADQPIVTIMDPSDIWVVANIKEGDVKKVRIGQVVEVKIASYDPEVEGRVERISRVTAAISGQEQRASNNIQGMSPVVPIRISLDEGHPSLIPGSSADIKIRVR